MELILFLGLFLFVALFAVALFRMVEYLLKGLFIVVAFPISIPAARQSKFEFPDLTYEERFEDVYKRTMGFFIAFVGVILALVYIIWMVFHEPSSSDVTPSSDHGSSVQSQVG